MSSSRTTRYSVPSSLTSVPLCTEYRPAEQSGAAGGGKRLLDRALDLPPFAAGTVELRRLGAEVGEGETVAIGVSALAGRPPRHDVARRKVAALQHRGEDRVVGLVVFGDAWVDAPCRAPRGQSVRLAQLPRLAAANTGNRRRPSST